MQTAFTRIAVLFDSILPFPHFAILLPLTLAHGSRPSMATVVHEQSRCECCRYTATGEQAAQAGSPFGKLDFMA